MSLGRASERLDAGLEQAELITLGVGQDMPLLVPGLADVGPAGTELQEAFELGVLVAVGGVDVDVQPGLPGSGSSRTLKKIVGCGPPNPSGVPISTQPSSRPTTT